MRKLLLLSAAIAAFGSAAYSQSLKKPDVISPSLKLVRVPKYHANVAGSMGLFDWNFSLGYINKDATVAPAPVTAPALSTSGQFVMFHLQESLLSNYKLARKYKRDKRFKFGFQNTFDLGMRMGGASEKSTSSIPIDTQVATPKFFFNYQAGIATAFRINAKADVGYTYYLYTQSIFAPDVRSYHKARFRYSHLMAEYSFGGRSAVDLKYVWNRKSYFGVSYSKSNQAFTTYPLNTYNVDTKWYQVSIGKVF